MNRAASRKQIPINYFTMSALTFQLNPTLNVSVHSFAFECSYAGILAGDMQAINQHILEAVEQRAAVLLFQVAPSQPQPIFIRQPAVDSRTGWLPEFVCFALLHGPTVKGRPDSDEWYVMGSRVGYVWFTNDVNLRLSDLIATGLESFDWGKIAENLGI